MPPEWLELERGCWIRHYEFAEETVGVIAGKRGLLVVDTRATEQHAAELRRDIEELTPKPILAAVNTHGHWDHAFGNAGFSDVPIWGHTATPAFMAATSEPMRKRLLATAEYASSAGAIRAVRITAPTKLFARRTRIDLGGRLVLLEHLDKAHTDSDVVVTVPDAGVVFVGDLVKGAGPPGYRDAYPHAWVAAGRRLLTRTSDSRVVPGHGPVVDHTFVEAWVDTLDRTARSAVSVVRGAMTLPAAEEAAGIHPRALEQAVTRVRTELSVGG